MIHRDYSYDPGAELGASSISSQFTIELRASSISSPFTNELRASSISRQFTIELLLPRFTLTVSFTKRCVRAHSDKENHV